MSFFPSCRGRIHHTSRRPEDEARCVVILLHGYGEHLGLSTTSSPADSSP
jgi:predicted esterase